MAVNDTIANQLQVTNGSSVDIRPASGVRWLIQSIWTSGAVSLQRVSGSTTVTLETTTGAKWWQGLVERVTDTVYLRISNNSGSTQTVGWAGVEVP